MSAILITAYKPYDDWQENASWLALQELTRSFNGDHEVTTRLYPVDFAEMKKQLANDMEANFDVSLHLGQAPGSGRIQFEAIGVNVAIWPHEGPEKAAPLADDGPIAYRSQLPLAEWAAKLRAAGIPSQVSFHAGTYLCNAALYVSHYLAETRGYKTQSTFVHLPLDRSQAVDARRDTAWMTTSETARGLGMVLEEI